MAQFLSGRLPLILSARYLSQKSTNHQIKEMNAQLYCANYVKQYDRENYLAALCVGPPTLKRTMFALRAFNVELSLIRDVTTNSDRAKVRLHFWSRLIDEIIKRNKSPLPDLDKDIAYYTHTPVAKELLDLFHLIDIDKYIETCLRDLIGARVSSKVLGYQPFEDMRELELYCSKSNTPIYQLTWQMDTQLNHVDHIEPNLRDSLIKISNNIGIAHGLSNVIRGLLYNSTKNCCYIPQSVLHKHQLTNRDFVGKKLDGDRIRVVVQELANHCSDLCDTVYNQLSGLPEYHRLIFLPRVSIQSSLKTLKKCNYDICDPRFNRRNQLLPLSLKLASINYRAPII